MIDSCARCKETFTNNQVAIQKTDDINNRVHTFCIRTFEEIPSNARWIKYRRPGDQRHYVYHDLGTITRPATDEYGLDAFFLEKNLMELRDNKTVSKMSLIKKMSEIDRARFLKLCLDMKHSTMESLEIYRLNQSDKENQIKSHRPSCPAGRPRHESGGPADRRLRQRSEWYPRNSRNSA